MADTIPDNSSNNIDINDSSACYESTLAQQDAIEKEIKASQPLISSPLDLSTLEEDFKDHDIYLQKLQELKKKYQKIRRLRRDGNCFYRAFGFVYLEHLLTTKNSTEAQRLKDSCTACKDHLLSVGYTQFTVEDFYEQFIGLIDLTMEEMSLPELEKAFNHQDQSDYTVVFLRLIVSSFLQKNETSYQPFIDQGFTMRQFCETEVEPVNHESDNIQIMALSEALGVTLCVENCQQSGVLNTIHFPDTNPPPASSSVTMLYRPGHYDVLYQ